MWENISTYCYSASVQFNGKINGVDNKSNKIYGKGSNSMSNKGYGFEVYCVDFFRKIFQHVLGDDTKNKVFRVIGSGRNKLATKTGEDTLLEGDVSIEIDTLPKNILIECKHHKSKTSKGKSHPVLKTWVDQALHEAINEKRWAAVAIKFKQIAANSKDHKQYVWGDGKFSNSVHYIIPEPHFAEMLLELEKSTSSMGLNKETKLSSLSNDELIGELVKRLKRSSG